MPGTLYLCSTPIGNLEDVTLRVLRVLGEVDVIAAEDTRRTRKLLTRHGVSGKVVSYHEGNEQSQAEYLVERLRRGDRIALVTDSGTPTISDPGYRLVRAAIDSGVPIEVLPGASAVTAAVAVSGLPTDRFVFEGFLPRKGADRRRRLEMLATESRTAVIFESPSRLVDTLKTLSETLGERRVALARELTKIHEEVLRGTLSQLLGELRDKEVLGEFVIVIEGAKHSEGDLNGAIEFARDLMAEGSSRSAAAREASHKFGIERRRVYAAIEGDDYSAENGSQG